MLPWGKFFRCDRSLTIVTFWNILTEMCKTHRFHPFSLTSGKQSPIRRRSILWLLGMLAGFQCAMAAAPGTFTLRIAVDQFGYLPDMPKVAVISDPQIGFNAGESYTPGSTLEVRTWGSNTVVFSGRPSPGATA